MNMRRTILSTALIFTLGASALPVSESNAQTFNYGTQQIGEGAKITKRTEDAYSKKLGITQNIQFDFIDDPQFDKDAVIIKMQGHIQSRTQFRWYKNQHTKTAQMLWPSKYHVNIKANNDDTNVINFLPKNNIDSINVSETTGYSIGGSFGTDLSAGLNSGYNYSKSITYNQQNFKSEVINQSSKSIGWDVIANEFLLDGRRFNAQDKNAFISWDSYANTPRGFFWEDPELPVLIKSGFNPSFITTLTKEKNDNDTSVFEITYGRTLDITNAWKTSTHSGASYVDSYHQPEVYKNRNYTVKYEVNWKTHSVKIIG